MQRPTITFDLIPARAFAIPAQMDGVTAVVRMNSDLERRVPHVTGFQRDTPPWVLHQVTINGRPVVRRVVDTGEHTFALTAYRICQMAGLALEKVEIVVNPTRTRTVNPEQVKARMRTLP